MVQNIEQLRERIVDLTTKDSALEIAEFILRKLGKTSEDNAMSADEIFQRINEEGIDFPGTQNTFKNYLSSGSQVLESPVTSTGRGRGGGYYISEVVEQVASGLDQQVDERQRTERESLLYNAVKEWLIGEGYKADLTDTMRRLGKWGNPDVTGIKVTEHLGRVELEVVTVEVKPSTSQWEYLFFEAVAHRRFANRAYFAFPVSEEMVNSGKLPEGIRYYCELYEVGVLILVLPNEPYRRFISDEGHVHEISIDEIQVHEVVGPPWSFVPMGQQRKFCEAIKINGFGELFNWPSLG